MRSGSLATSRDRVVSLNPAKILLRGQERRSRPAQDHLRAAPRFYGFGDENRRSTFNYGWDILGEKSLEG